MRYFLKKSGRFLVKFLLSLLAFFCVALISLQVILIVGINTVSTGRGSAFLSDKINEVMRQSGYTIGFDALYYDPVQGISVRDFSLSDTAGSFLHIDRFSLNMSFILSPMRTLNISAGGGTLRLSRLPVTLALQDKQEKAYPEPFSVPDIYFRKISLTDFSFEHVVIEEAVTGKVYALSPSLKAELSLSDKISVSAKMYPGLGTFIENIDAPMQIDFTGSLAPSTLDFIVDKASIEATSYSISGEGTGNIGADASLQISVKAAHTDLSALTQDALQEAFADISVNGPMTAPAINVDAKLVSTNFKERGLSDIFLQIKTDNIQDGLKGSAHIETAFKNDPVTIDADLSFTDPELFVENIQANAPNISLTGDAVFSTQTSLVDGTLSLSAHDLAHYKDLAGINIAGKLDIKSVLKASDNGKQAADFDIDASNIIVDTTKIKKLEAQAFIASLANPWPQSAKLQSTGIQIANDTVIDNLDASISELTAENYRLALKGRGRMPSPISFDGGADISDITQAMPAFQNIALNVHQGESTAKIAGYFLSDKVDLAITAKDFRSKDIPADLPAQLDHVRIDVNGAVTGNPSAPKTEMAATLRGVGTGAYKNATIHIKADHNGEQLNAIITGNGTGIRKLDVVLGAPMSWAMLPFHFTLNPSAPLTGSIAANIDLAAITPIFMPPTQILEGTLIANGAITGTISAPEPKASIELSEAQFEDGTTGIIIDKLSVFANITKSAFILESLSATDGKAGRINGKGVLPFDGSAANIDIQARNFNAPRSDLANGIMNADITLQGNAGKLDLRGKADIQEMNVLIPEKFSSNIPQLNIIEDTKEKGPGILENLTLDITVSANNQIFVRGWGLDAEFGGSIAVTGSASEPQFNGAFTSRRGRFEEFGKRFRLERANLRFQGNVPPSPYLDIEATTPAGEVTGAIVMTGPVQSPSIKFASTPSLPEDEVLSRILFGKDSAKISPFQAVQLAQTIRRFSGEGGGGFDPLATIRSATGLDDISVETDESGGASVGAGKYLTDNVYLEVSKGKAENSGEATIQIELTPSINIQSEIGQDAQGGGGVFWKHDY